MNEEQRKLDEALEQADPLLLASLQRDERRRRNKLLVLGVTGGLVMGAIVTAVVMVLLAGAQVTPADVQRSNQISAEGWRLWQQRQLTDAAAKFEEAVKLNPRNANAWNGLGWARFNGGMEGADDAFRKAVEIQPNHPAALNGLGQSALARGDLANAEKYLLKAAPQAPAAWWGLTRLYLVQEKWDQATQWAQKIVSAEPDNEEARMMLQAAKNKQVPEEVRQSIPTTAPATQPAE